MDRSVEIQSALINYTREFFDRLNTLWSEMGYDRIDIEARNEKAAQHVKKLCGDMIEDQESEKALVIAEIETLLEQADKLEKELKVKINVDVGEIPLLRVKDCLNDRLEQYLIRRAERVEKRASLLKQAGELSLAMGKVDIPNLPQVPSEEELEDLKKLISNYVQEKNQRMETFSGLRARIIAAMESLELEPELDFERQVIASKKFVLSDDNMIALRELSQTMERRLAETKELVDELREKLSVLWDRLNEAPALREAFLFGYSGIGKDTIAAIRAEIARCEERKRANIKQFVLAVREELQEYWVKCFFSNEQQEEFTHFKSDLFVEDLLDFHEQELERVKQFYKDHQRLFDLVQQRHEIWERKAALECRSKSSSRLYDNRGGKLLLEEKERKTINRKLPKIEAELLTLANQYKEEKGRPFLVDGKTVTEFLNSQWKQHEAGKEQQKLERKERNQTLGETCVGKRKLAQTPLHMSAKRCRPDTNPTQTVKTPGSVQAPALQVRVDPVRKAKIARRAFESKIARRMPATNQNINPNTVAAAADTTTYTEFQVQLESRVATRSSAKLNTVNRNVTCQNKTPDRNATYRARTPAGVRTPINTRTPTRSPAPLSIAKSRLQTPARNRLPFLI